MPCEFDPRINVLIFWNTRLRVRLMWPKDAVTWRLDRDRSHQQAPYVLVARMSRLRCPLDFFLLPAEYMTRLLDGDVPLEIPQELAPYWCRVPAEVIHRVGEIVRTATDGARVG
jgi:hypothetical protein